MSTDNDTMNPNVFEDAARAVGRVADLAKRGGEVLDRVAAIERSVSQFADVAKAASDNACRVVGDAAQSVKLVHTDILSLRQELANVNREFGTAFSRLVEQLKQASTETERLVKAESDRLAQAIARHERTSWWARRWTIVLGLVTWAAIGFLIYRELSR